MIQRLHWNVLYLHIWKWGAEQKEKKRQCVDQKHMQLIDPHTERVFMQQQNVAFVQLWWQNVCIYSIMYFFSVSQWYLTSHGIYSEWIKMCPVWDICCHANICISYCTLLPVWVQVPVLPLTLIPLSFSRACEMVMPVSPPARMWSVPVTICQLPRGDLTPHATVIVLCDKWSL